MIAGATMPWYFQGQASALVTLKLRPEARMLPRVSE